MSAYKPIKFQMSNEHRDKIKNSNILKHLIEHVEGTRGHARMEHNFSKQNKKRNGRQGEYGQPAEHLPNGNIEPGNPSHDEIGAGEIDQQKTKSNWI